MAATTAVEVGFNPNHRDFMEWVTDSFRTVREKVWAAVKTTAVKAVQVAKKAGNWMLSIPGVAWTWNKVRFAAKKVWKWTGDAVPYLILVDMLNFAAAGLGVAVGFKMATKLIALMSAIGVAAAIAVVIHVVRKRRKEKVVGITAEEVSSGSEEPEEKPKRKRVTRKVTKITEEAPDGTTTETTTVTTEDLQEAVAAVNEILEEAEKTETEAPAAEAPAAVSAKGNGYKVRLPEGDLIPTETLQQRMDYLHGLVEAEKAKPKPDGEYVAELMGRANLIHVRMGKHSQVKKDAPASTVHNAFADSLEKAWRDTHDDKLGPREETGIYRSALNKGAVAESGRVEKIRQLKVKHDQLKGKKAA